MHFAARNREVDAAQDLASADRGTQTRDLEHAHVSL